MDGCTFGAGVRFAVIDIIDPRPGRAGMRVQLVEIPSLVDVRPGAESPAYRSERPRVFGMETKRRFFDHCIHMADQPLPRGSAKLQGSGFGMPTSDIGQFRAPMSARMLEDAVAQLRVELRTVCPDVSQQGSRKNAFGLRA